MTGSVQHFVGATAYDASGHKIGKIHEIFVDASTREPKWVTVNHGLFGMSSAFVPLAGAHCDRNAVRVAVDKATVKQSPSLRVRAGITPEEEHRLARHYHLSDTPAPAPQPPERPAGRHSAGIDIATAAAGIGGTAFNTAAHTAHPDEPSTRPQR
ncbi:PRC-barrel domain-containing protein [Mycobacterium sp. BMJ-28]